MKSKIKQQKIEEWIQKNGGCSIDLKNENIWLYNGGLFQDANEKGSELWIGDLDSTIRYLRRLRSFLIKLGFNTNKGI